MLIVSHFTNIPTTVDLIHYSLVVSIGSYYQITRVEMYRPVFVGVHVLERVQD